MGIENTENTPVEQELSPQEQMLGLLDTEDGTTDTEDTEEPTDVLEDETTDELEDDESLEEEETEEDDVEEEETDELDEEEEEEGSEEDDELFEIQIDGQDQEVTLTELSEGYLRQSDYTKKTQALSSEKQEVDQMKGELTQLRANLVSQIEAFKGNDQAKLVELNKLDWQDLKDTDPEEYLLKKAEKADLVDRIEQAQADQIKLAQEQHAENVKAFEAQRQQANEYLASDKGIPGWGDEKEFPKIQEALRETGLALGYTKEELNVAIDPRALQALWMASQFMKTQKAAPRIKAKRKGKVPKVTKPNAKKTRMKATRKAKLMKKARSTGSQQDAAAAIHDLLD